MGRNPFIKSEIVYPFFCLFWVCFWLRLFRSILFEYELRQSAEGDIRAKWNSSPQQSLDGVGILPCSKLNLMKSCRQLRWLTGHDWLELWAFKHSEQGPPPLWSVMKGVVWYGMVWCVVWHDVVWYGVVCVFISAEFGCSVMLYL